MNEEKKSLAFREGAMRMQKIFEEKYEKCQNHFRENDEMTIDTEDFNSICMYQFIEGVLSNDERRLRP